MIDTMDMLHQGWIDRCKIVPVITCAGDNKTGPLHFVSKCTPGREIDVVSMCRKAVRNPYEQVYRLSYGSRLSSIMGMQMNDTLLLKVFSEIGGIQEICKYRELAIMDKHYQNGKHEAPGCSEKASHGTGQ